MASVENYQSGRAAKMVKNSVDQMMAGLCPSSDSEFGRFLLPVVEQSAPAVMNLEQVKELIDDSRVCAVGDRVCFCEFPDTPKTIAVFLDELAEGMVESCKAEIVTKAQAKKAIADCPGNPVIVSRVDGEYQEICRTWSEKCLFWNMEKMGIRCLKRPGEST